MKPISPCPLCDSRNVSIVTRNDKNVTDRLKLLRTVKCNSCGLSLTRDELDEAINAWNERSEQ